MQEGRCKEAMGVARKGGRWPRSYAEDEGDLRTARGTAEEEGMLSSNAAAAVQVVHRKECLGSECLASWVG